MIAYQDTMYIDLDSLFPGEDISQRDEKMIKLCSMVEKFLHENSAFKGRIVWANIFEQELNPEFSRGFLRFIQEV